MNERAPGCGCQYYRALEKERDAFRVELNKLIAANNALRAKIRKLRPAVSKPIPWSEK